jgi:hypothetical protein
MKNAAERLRFLAVVERRRAGPREAVVGVIVRGIAVDDAREGMLVAAEVGDSGGVRRIVLVERRVGRLALGVAVGRLLAELGVMSKLHVARVGVGVGRVGIRETGWVGYVLLLLRRIIREEGRWRVVVGCRARGDGRRVAFR